jgi:hypothetical protein
MKIPISKFLNRRLAFWMALPTFGFGVLLYAQSGPPPASPPCKGYFGSQCANWANCTPNGNNTANLFACESLSDQLPYVAPSGTPTGNFTALKVTGTFAHVCWIKYLWDGVSGCNYGPVPQIYCSYNSIQMATGACTTEKE